MDKDYLIAPDEPPREPGERPGQYAIRLLKWKQKEEENRKKAEPKTTRLKTFWDEYNETL